MTAILQKNLSKAGAGATVPRALEQENADRLILVVTFLLIFIMAARTPLDTDMWWHLSAGREMLSTGRWLTQDIFTVTRLGAQWTNPMWLFQSVMAVLFGAAGFLGLSGLIAFTAVLSMWLVERQCEGPAALKAVGLLLGSVVASTCWPPRPLLASLVGLAGVSYLLYQYKWRSRDFLWFLPLIFVLWSNLHGGYPLGLILIGANIAGEILNHIVGAPAGQALSWKRIQRLVLVGIICGFAVLINPNGLEMWKLPFATVSMQALQIGIPEWASPDFHILIEQSLAWLLLAVVGVVALSGRRMDGSELLSLLVFAFMALLARRNFGPFALVAVPIFTRYASLTLAEIRKRSPLLKSLEKKQAASTQNRPVPPALRRTVNFLIVALLGTVAVLKLYGVTHPALVDHYEKSIYPAQSIAWLRENRSPGRIFNEYDWGGYLQWRLSDHLIFIDGRTDLFGDEIIGQWAQVTVGDPGWQTVLDTYQIDYLLLRPNRPVLQHLPPAEWEMLYQDSVSVLYGRR